MNAYTLVGADGQRYESTTRGTIGGHPRTRVHGRLDCAAAPRAIAKGDYVKHRVFFADEQTTRRVRPPLATRDTWALKLLNDRLHLSPSNVTAYLACPHLTTLELAVARGGERAGRARVPQGARVRGGLPGGASRRRGKTVREITLEAGFEAAEAAIDDYAGIIAARGVFAVGVVVISSAIAGNTP